MPGRTLSGGSCCHGCTTWQKPCVLRTSNHIGRPGADTQARQEWGGKHERGLEGMVEQFLADMQPAPVRELDNRRQNSRPWRTQLRIRIATDHGGSGLKEALPTHLRAAGHEVVDFGAHSRNPSDAYPDFVIPLARAWLAGEVERGVAICGSGVGAAVCANKVRGIRAA